MKLSPLLPLLAPPLWSYTAGFTFGTLAAVLGSDHADVVTVSARAVGFALSFPVVGWMVQQSREPSAVTDITRRDWQAARERVTQEEREAYQYQALARPGNLALGVANGKRTQVFHFPAGITLAHLTAFGELIASGQPPRYRNLKTTFDHALWSTFRDWLMVAELNKFARLAEYTGGRDEWDATSIGRRMAVIWLCQTSPTSVTSEAIKCSLRVEQNNKTIVETI